MPGRLQTALKILGTSSLAVLVLGGILAAYVIGTSSFTPTAITCLWAVWSILGLHLLTQQPLRYLEHDKCGKVVMVSRNLRVALCIAAFQEDPEYLRKYLNKYDSWISFLSSGPVLDGINVERACQSYLHIVQSQDPFTETELLFLVTGAILYACYWLALCFSLYLA
ncbi:hypothetical protein GDO81_015879 [Engystomops pustulosus]|uniref:Uncharacterized protein n=1 Tax=Engystomops pustulosus TaxID=76066 RepID=A0AAV7AUK6_ENGPU|nr:hypothetical protein GDO81_015879 [Engystomops pustulosus]KAG8562957.1 hypothetical protein GDO81_015879 [Engystomops pustulosus]